MGFDPITYALCKGGGGAWKEIGSAVIDSSVNKAVFTQDVDGKPFTYDSFSDIVVIFKVTTGDSSFGQPRVYLTNTNVIYSNQICYFGHSNGVLKNGGVNYMVVNANLFPGGYSGLTMFHASGVSYPWKSTVVNTWAGALTEEEKAEVSGIMVDFITGTPLSAEIYIYGRVN